jgi:hypothetical protein
MQKFFFRNSIILFALVVVLFGLQFFYTPQKTTQSLAKPSVMGSETKKVTDYFSYKGKDGVDALTLLKQKTSVELEPSGLVSSINKRKADNVKHEYWAFYVNAKLASVGPANYKTKNMDLIEWKIEKY